MAKKSLVRGALQILVDQLNEQVDTDQIGASLEEDRIRYDILVAKMDIYGDLARIITGILDMSDEDILAEKEEDPT